VTPSTPEQVTQVTTETTALPTSATAPEAQPPADTTTTTATPPPATTPIETPAPVTAPAQDEAPVTTPVPPPPVAPVRLRRVGRERTGGTEAPAGALGLGSHAERALVRAARLSHG
jgi:hypothetical protein